jgi:Zn-dependent M28 family amino/carboxypeptidase
MKKLPSILILLVVSTILKAQNIDEKYVRKVINTLASDEMMGRSAATPKYTDKAVDFIASQFKDIGLEQLNGVTDYRQPFTEKRWPSVKMYNVVGVLRGKSKPDEFVVFGAHYDHIGVIQPVAGDSIANGADDDASGTTAVITLAKYFKAANNNERTLIFVTFSAEEIGGAGSKYFTEQLDANKVVAMFNIEMIGKHSKWV